MSNSVVLAQKDNELVVLAHFDFGLRVQYNVLQGTWYLTCLVCNARIDKLRGAEAASCVKCRKTYPSYKDVPLFHMHGVPYGQTVEMWMFPLLDPFEALLSADAVARTLKEIAVRLSKPNDDDPTYTNEEIENVCRTFSGPIEF